MSKHVWDLSRAIISLVILLHHLRRWHNIQIMYCIHYSSGFFRICLIDFRIYLSSLLQWKTPDTLLFTHIIYIYGWWKLHLELEDRLSRHMPSIHFSLKDGVFGVPSLSTKESLTLLLTLAKTICSYNLWRTVLCLNWRI